MNHLESLDAPCCYKDVFSTSCLRASTLFYQISFHGLSSFQARCEAHPISNDGISAAWLRISQEEYLVSEIMQS